MHTAIARSKCEPSFLISEGERFMTIFLPGYFSLLLVIADFILSRDSLTEISGRPTIEKFGIPFEISASTVTVYPLIPSNAQVILL